MLDSTATWKWPVSSLASILQAILISWNWRKITVPTWKPINYYLEKARITISLTLYQTVRHEQVLIKYGYFIHRDNFSFEKRVKWFFISDLTLKGQKVLIQWNSATNWTLLLGHLRSNRVKFNATSGHHFNFLRASPHFLVGSKPRRTGRSNFSNFDFCFEFFWIRGKILSKSVLVDIFARTLVMVYFK